MTRQMAGALGKVLAAGVFACVLVQVRARAAPEPSAAPQGPGPWIMGLRHAGPLTFGSVVEDVRRLLGDPGASLMLDGGAQPDDARCAYLSTPSVPPTMKLMFRRGRLARIDVIAMGPQTQLGAQVGDSEEAVLQRYPGRLDVGLHPFLDDSVGHYLMYRRTLPEEHDFGLTFETRDGVVTSYRVGGRSAVALIDGCHS
jgi:hypothetical protein